MICRTISKLGLQLDPEMKSFIDLSKMAKELDAETFVRSAVEAANQLRRALLQVRNSKARVSKPEPPAKLGRSQKDRTNRTATDAPSQNGISPYASSKEDLALQEKSVPWVSFVVGYGTPLILQL